VKILAQGLLCCQVTLRLVEVRELDVEALFCQIWSHLLKSLTTVKIDFSVIIILRRIVALKVFRF